MANLLKNLWKHIHVFRKIQILILLFLMILASVAEVLSISAVLPFLAILMSPDKIFEYSVMKPVARLMDEQSLLNPIQLITVVFCLAILASGFIRLLLVWQTTKLSFAIGADISSDIYKKTLYQPYLAHISRNSSSVISAISRKVDTVIGGVILPLLNIISSLIILLIIVLTLFYINPYMALLGIFGFSFIYLIVMQFTRRKLSSNSIKIASDSSLVIKSLQEGLGGIRDILINGSQKIYCSFYEVADRNLRRAQGENQFISLSPKYIIESIGIILIATGAYKLLNGGGDPLVIMPVLGAFALGAQRLLPILQQLFYNWASLKGSHSSLIDIVDLLNQPLPKLSSDGLVKLPFKEKIELRNIHFKYGEELPWVLKGIDLEIKKGERIGLIGKTGGGKSTAIDLIMGLLSPDHGRLLVDGVEITSSNCNQWQSRIAHVPQSIFLSDTTLIENIAFGVPKNEINYARVDAAIAYSQLSELVYSWPGGYYTLVGERGAQLSGGQRQRVGLARALYREADVIVLDEATSALDSETEKAVMDAIEALPNELTIMIVAHRLSTLKNCDHIYEISKGALRDLGVYSELSGK